MELMDFDMRAEWLYNLVIPDLCNRPHYRPVQFENLADLLDGVDTVLKQANDDRR